MKYLVYIFLFGALACTKYEVKDAGNNQPPVDFTVTEIAKVSYINKLFITLLGAKPTEQQSTAAMAQLNVDPKSQSVRESLVLSIINEDDYEYKVWQDARGEVLDGVDTATIRLEYNRAIYFYNNSSGNTKDYWQAEIARLALILDIPKELKANLITIPEMHSRAVNNGIYDDINMGTENFVVSVFQNFFFRYPTNSELSECKKMVDGKQAVLFLQVGNSKTDFLNVVFTSTSYFEGQIVNAYLKYLFRNPTSQELSIETKAYQTHKNYDQLQIQILASDEYFYD